MKVSRIVLFAAILLLPAVCVGRQQAGAAASEPNLSPTFTNPLWKGADPWIVKQGGLYYTCKSVGTGIEVSRSRFLTRKEEIKVVWRTPEKSWNSYFVWAPELHFIDGMWYIYYAAGRENTLPYIWQRTGVLRAKDPMGPYSDMGELYTGDDPDQKKDNVWGIDMTVFTHRDKLYAVWSGWERNRKTDKTQQNLYIALMANPWTIGRRVLLTTPTQPWEKGEAFALVEGPAVIRHEGDVFIMYSTRGSWTIHYKMGQLRLRSAESDPLDPASWIKSGPVFEGNEHVLGVGHASFTTSPDDTQWWIYYHTKADTIPGWNRRACLQQFTFDAEGNPCFGPAVQPGEPLERPSGEYQMELKKKKKP